ncbi:hypothetical protein CYMTET_16630 [Cymbomonas tetramitiformis]|uniref:Ubiquitin-like protease family profile domain-containing protein n=1 Tax=Cymbomonas tetramitiformis TaxID=36881 RepID=A0AAE0GC76_9CHLO|nr:hypothetical protein CYMTET_16630 [Cymbomonas tetramitiformis]
MDKVLDYHDVLLRAEDLRLLTGPEWLNDQIIAFYFEYLDREKCVATSDVLFLNGSVSFFASHSSPDDLKQMAGNLPRREHIFFAVNNNPFTDVAEGGSHWSLLTFR